MQKRALSNDDLGNLSLFVAILLGAWFRLSIPINAGFPIGDGGLFHVMVKAVQANHYRLPELVQYNGLDIPFAYPPFGFYVASLFADLFHTSAINILLWLPACVLVATIPAIYFLASQILKSKFKAGLAALCYALIPGSVAWLIMGGGITRSFGQLFLILATANIYLLFTTGQGKYIGYSILFSALVCLSHPEATIHTLTIAVLLWLIYGKSRDGILNALKVALGTLLLTSPWWLIVLLRFGLSPYLSAAQTGLSQAVILLAPFVSFSQETFLPVLSMLAILGIAHSIARREYLLPAFYILPFVVEARNATNVYIIPLALLASMALSDMLLPALSKAEGAILNREFKLPLQSLAEKFLLGYFLVILVMGMQIASVQFSERQVSPEVRTAFNWIQANTPSESSFLVLTGVTGQLNDFTNEWFPVLANRKSVTTIQGLEWTGNNRFTEYRPALASVQTCRAVPDIVKCIETVPYSARFTYDYIVVTTDPSTSATNGIPAMENILVNTEYQIVYSSKATLIIQKRPASNP